jgi:hypothetical protein
VKRAACARFITAKIRACSAGVIDVMCRNHAVLKRESITVNASKFTGIKFKRFNTKAQSV